MKSSVVLDSTVVVAFCDPYSPFHAASHAALTTRLNSHRLVLPASAFCDVLAYADAVDSKAVRIIEHVANQLIAEVVTVDRLMSRVAARYRVTYPWLGLAPALTLATAKVVSADEVLTTNESLRELEHYVRVLS